MKKRIFRSILTVSIAVLLVAFFGVFVLLYQAYSDIQFQELAKQTDLIASMVEETGDRYLKVLDDSSYRLNLISPEGIVLYDSGGEEELLNNHLYRQEIQQAMKEGVGQAVRYSSTLASETFYIAQQLSDGSFIRISVTLSSIYGLLLHLLVPFLLLLGGVLVLSLVLADRLSRSIVKPILAIDLDHPLQTRGQPEMRPLLERIEASNQQIQQQMEQLQTKSKEFEAVCDHMDEGLILLGPDRQLLTCNEAARRIFDIQEDWQVQQAMPIPRALEQADRRGRTTISLHRQGRDYVLETAVIAEENEKKGYILLILDTTEKVEAQKRRQEFTANVTHELKTPIQTIMASTELLQAGMVKQEDEARFLKYISKEARRLVAMINDIIQLSRLDAGSQEPQEMLDLSELVTDLADSLEAGCHARSIHMELDLEDVCVEGPRSTWQELMGNLMENAVKYNREQGSVGVRLARKQEQDNAWIVFTVEDTGIGIPKADQERVFERFFRVDKSHSSTVGGSGLGLAIVRHAAAALGGFVTLQSTLDVGTTIQVRIPQPESRPDPVCTPDEEIESPDPSGGSKPSAK